MKAKLPAAERRTLAQLREHYEIEKELAQRLKQAPKQRRASLYGETYNELFKRVPHHPQWTKRETTSREKALAAQIRLLAPYLLTDSVFLEIGAGDCALSIQIAGRVRQAYSVEVSDELTRGISRPPNFELLISNGTEINLPSDTVSVAYSFQLMEHVHPDDATAQLQEIYRVLQPGGIYFCITPNRLSGPHDISRYFDEEATGLHLKEYSVGDLVELFRATGFDRIWVERVIKSRRIHSPIGPLVAAEKVLAALPFRLRAAIARSWFGSRMLDVSVIGQKRAAS